MRGNEANQHTVASFNCGVIPRTGGSFASIDMSKNERDKTPCEQNESAFAPTAAEAKTGT
jgi:hypothetical protein